MLAGLSDCEHPGIRVSEDGLGHNPCHTRATRDYVKRSSVLGLGLLDFHSVLPASCSMAKGSQLSQLKSALSQAGVTKSHSGNKRKRSNNEDADKERRAAKLRDIQQKMNPFDVQVTKVKHDVGGRRIKGAVGRPAQSKQAGIHQVRRAARLSITVC